MFLLVSAALMLLAVVSCTDGGGRAPSEADDVPITQTLVIQGGTLFDGTGGDLLENATVIIEGNRIKSVGRNLDIPEGASVVDVQGKMILPGLIDPHIHFREWMPQLFLYFGVTSVFDTANPTDWILEQKRALAQKKIAGPRMYVTGLVIDGPAIEGAPPHPTEIGGYRIHVNQPEEARQWVRLLQSKGVDGIKVHDGLTPELLSAVVDEAERYGFPVVGHSWNASEAIESGLRFIEHVTPVARATLSPEVVKELGGSEEIVHLMDERHFDRVIQQMVALRVVFNPTLRRFARLTPLEEEFSTWNRRFVDQNPVPEVLRRRAMREPARDEAPSVEELEAYRKTLQFLRQYVAAGGKLTPGSDTGPIPGLGLHEEMEFLVEFGATPLQALLGATRDAAELMGKLDELGTVEPGKLADLAIIEGNPLARIRDSRNISMVVLDGKILERTLDPEFKNPIPRTAVNEVVVPHIEAVEPSVVRINSSSVELSLKGSDFRPSSMVVLSDRVLPVRFVSPNELRTDVPEDLTKTAGTLPLTVINPESGGSVADFEYLIVGY